MKRQFEPGIYRGIPNEDYHAAHGISSSDLKKIWATTPAHWKHYKDHPEPATEAMNLGTAVHALVLEPDLAEGMIAVAPKVDRRTKIGKATWEDFQIESAGKLVVTEDQWAKARAMAEKVMAHPQAREALSGGAAEQSVFTEHHGHILKARPDHWTGPLLSDLKTTADASPDGFQRQAAKLAYHIQAAYYLHVCSQHAPAEDFVFIAVENFAPFEVACYLLDDDALAIGRDHMHEALQTLLQAKRSGHYPGYSSSVELLGLPGWMVARHEYSRAA